jgi:hypothetical protein
MHQAHHWRCDKLTPATDHSKAMFGALHADYEYYRKRKTTNTPKTENNNKKKPQKNKHKPKKHKDTFQ